jgi:probable FeS assembly SUF system protein SufT
MSQPNFYGSSITLSRDCPAVMIPEGSPVTLAMGTVVYVTQALGGAVTVNANGNLARIASVDVDALGMEPAALPAEHAQGNADGSVDTDLIWEQLSTCYDPEIPVNIVELGLIYRCEVKTGESGRNRVEIDLTLTAPGCGMGPFLVDDVRSKVAQVPNVSDVDIELVFDPPWNQDMMSEVARLETGMY